MVRAAGDGRPSTAVVACGSDPNANARRAGHRDHPPYQHHRPKDAAELLETWCKIRDLDGASAVIVERRHHHRGIAPVARLAPPKSQQLDIEEADGADRKSTRLNSRH